MFRIRPLPGCLSPVYSLCKLFFNFLPVVLLIVFVSTSSAQISEGGIPVGYSKSVSDVPLVDLSDHPVLYEEIDKEGDPFGPMKAGFGIPVAITPGKYGQFRELENGKILWQLKIHASGALGLGLVFDDFFLDQGDRMFVYNTDGSFHAGAFTSINNNPDNVFSTHIVPGDTLVIELETAAVPGQTPAIPGERTGTCSRLQIGEVIFIDNGGELPLFTGDKDPGDSGDCHVGINCHEGNNWQDEKRGVARILLREEGAWYWCTGSLVNNTAQDGTPYMLTSDHCGEASSPDDYDVWQFYFNFERPGCEETGSPPNNMIRGSTLKSKAPLDGGSDFKLLLLSDAPPESYHPYFNGWNLAETGSPAGVSIHHPGGDAMKISTYTSGLSSSDWPGSVNAIENGFWRVNWAETLSGHGITEGGSSGGPLFDYSGLIVGTLTGGASSCSNPQNPDFYGKMNMHWNANSEEDSLQLAPWLDPRGAELLSLEGYDPYDVHYLPPAGLEATHGDEDQVLLQWKRPGALTGPEGWVAYNTDFSHLTWQQPQRATRFSAADFDFSYPVAISRLAHYFMENTNHTWTDNRFQFVIYGNDGERILYESEWLEAGKDKLVYHYPDEPLHIEEDFYVAVVPYDKDGHPSSAAQILDHGEVCHSFVGEAGEWSPYVNEDGDYLELYTMVYILAAEEKEKNEELLSGGDPRSVRRISPFDRQEKNDRRSAAVTDYVRISDKDFNLVGYRVFRNNLEIASIEDPGIREFTDTEPGPGRYSYYVTALYDNAIESQRSNEVLVSVEAPPEYRDVRFRVVDQDGLPLENASVILTSYVGEDVPLFFEDWEDYPDFTTNLGPWRSEDPLEEITFVADDFTFPGEGQPFGFMTFNPDLTDPSIEFPAVSGDRYVVSATSLHAPTREEDKWLISPPIYIEENATLSFFARSLNAAYGLERIRVWASGDGTHREDFRHKLSEDTYIEVPDSWTEYTFGLSDYVGKTMHFAIQNVSHDSFMLMVDALGVEKAGGKSLDEKFAVTDQDGLAELSLPKGLYQYRVILDGYSGHRAIVSVEETDLDVEVVLSDTPFALTLESEPEEGGRVIDRTDAAPYAEGAEVTIEAVPSHGYAFVEWKRDEEEEAVSTEPRYSFTMDSADARMVALFEEDDTSLDDTSGLAAPEVFPNPTRGPLNIEVPSHIELRMIRLFNIHGQLVYEQSADQMPVHRLNLSSFPDGIYFLQMVTQNSVTARRILLTR